MKIGNEHTEMCVTIKILYDKALHCCEKVNVVLFIYFLLMQHLMYKMVNKSIFNINDMHNAYIRNIIIYIYTTSLSHSQ
jgi:hypothetical protein